MKAFEYAAPSTEAEAIELMTERAGTVEILAGGTDLVGLMKQMLVNPDRVVNLMEIRSLREIEPTPSGGVSIGAAVSLEQILDSHYLDPYASLKQAINNISSMQLRCQGTLGGELCQRPQCWFFRGGHGLLGDDGRAVAQGDNRYHAVFANAGPAKFVNNSRLAPALIVRDARLRIVGPSPDAEQWVDLADFYRIPRHGEQRENVLRAGQFVSHIELPDPGSFQCATYEVRQGAGPEYPLTAAAARLNVQSGVVRDAKIVLGHVAPTPWRSEDAEHELIGKPLTAETIEAAGLAAIRLATPLSRNEYKVTLAQVSVERAVRMAAGLPPGGF
ncbi:MAG: molybdopterin dehydrogenase [Planctomycetes bacterium]|nr:molybdopterin dehydrogenase [Planctomycetota bacterium]